MVTEIIYPKTMYNFNQVRTERIILGKEWLLSDDNNNYYLRPDLSRLLKGGKE
jgi:hypothetical protein